jgi:hypothetical protein
MNRLLNHDSAEIQRHVKSDNAHDRSKSSLGDITPMMFCKTTDKMGEKRFLDGVVGDLVGEGDRFVYDSLRVEYMYNRPQKKMRITTPKDRLTALFGGVSQVVLHVDVGKKLLVTSLAEKLSDRTQFVLNDNIFSQYDPAGTIILKQSVMPTVSGSTAQPHIVGLPKKGRTCSSVRIKPSDIRSPLELLGVNVEQTWDVDRNGPTLSIKHDKNTHVFDHYSAAKSAGRGQHEGAHAVAKYAGDSGQVLSTFLEDGIEGERMFWSYDRLAVVRGLMAGVDIVAYEHDRDSGSGPFYLDLFVRKTIIQTPQQLMDARDEVMVAAQESLAKYDSVRAKHERFVSQLRAVMTDVFSRASNMGSGSGAAGVSGAAAIGDGNIGARYAYLLGAAQALPIAASVAARIEFGEPGAIPPVTDRAEVERSLRLIAEAEPNKGKISALRDSLAQLRPATGRPPTRRQVSAYLASVRKTFRDVGSVADIQRKISSLEGDLNEAGNVYAIADQLRREIKALKTFISTLDVDAREAAIDAATASITGPFDTKSLLKRVKFDASVLSVQPRTRRGRRGITFFDAARANDIIHAARRFRFMPESRFAEEFASILSDMSLINNLEGDSKYAYFVEAAGIALSELAMEPPMGAAGNSSIAAIMNGSGKVRGRRKRARGLLGKRKAGDRSGSASIGSPMSKRPLVLSDNPYIVDEYMAMLGRDAWFSDGAAPADDGVTEHVHINYLYNALLAREGIVSLDPDFLRCLRENDLPDDPLSSVRIRYGGLRKSASLGGLTTAGKATRKAPRSASTGSIATAGSRSGGGGGGGGGSWGDRGKRTRRGRRSGRSRRRRRRPSGGTKKRKN